MVSIVSGESERGCKGGVSELASYLPSGQTLKKMFLGYLALSGAGTSAARLLNRPVNDVSIMRLPVGANGVATFHPPIHSSTHGYGLLEGIKYTVRRCC